MNDAGEMTGEKKKQLSLIQVSSMETKAFTVTKTKKERELHKKATKNSYISVATNLKETTKTNLSKKTSNKNRGSLSLRA